MKQYNVSIIVPIYNVEKYIERCVVSLFEQDFEDIEYIFVNDCTPDNSIEILEEVLKKYPNRKADVKVFHQEENKGLGNARRLGMSHASGEYYIQIDSDDWCELNMISQLYNKAKEIDADVVACDYYDSYIDTGDIYHKQYHTGEREQDVWNMYIGHLRPFDWNKLIKRDLHIKNGILYPIDMNIATDTWFILRIYSVAERIGYVPNALYHYWRDNMASISNKITPKYLDELKWFVEATEDFMKQRNIYEKYKFPFNTHNLHVVIWANKGVFSKEVLSQVCPKSIKLKYIWAGRYRFGAKVKYSLMMLGLDKTTNALLSIKRKLF